MEEKKYFPNFSCFIRSKLFINILLEKQIPKNDFSGKAGETSSKSDILD